MKKNPLCCAFFIEDEKARNYLNDLLSESNSIEVISDIHSSLEAIELLNHQKPAVLFIETKYLQILQSVHKPPFIIGICNKTQTKLIKHYLSIGIFDIIFTPIEEKQCFNVLGKIMNIYSTYNQTKERLTIAEETLAYNEYNQRTNMVKEFIFLKKNDESTRININDIAFLTRKSNQITFQFDNGSRKQIKKSLKHYQNLLPEEQFQKINKETIINLDKVTKLINSDKIVVSNQIFQITRSFLKPFKEKIRQ